MRLVKAQLVLDYKHFYNQEPPEDKLSLISHLPKTVILAEIVGLNYRLKPNNRHYIDFSRSTQIRELKYFSQTPELTIQNLKIFNRHSYDNFYSVSYPLIFTRQTCLYAIEQILNSDGLNDDLEGSMPNLEAWVGLFKYLLSVNSEIDKINNDNNHSIENINAKLLPLNELGVDTDFALTLYKGYKLIRYFIDTDEYKNAINLYFSTVYNCTYGEFLERITKLYFVNNEFKFFYHTEQAGEKFLDDLSKRHHQIESIKLINIKKSPFIKVDEDKYLISDISMLVDKSYYQFINDFWFDYLKGETNDEGKNIFTIKNYRGEVGLFFETYISEIIKRIFTKHKNIVVLMFDELKIKIKKSSIEIADLYVRNGNKILIGQVKSGMINDKQKFGGDVMALYDGDREKFFDNFGMHQLIESINRIDNLIPTLDHRMPRKAKFVIYPCIVLSDKIFQTALMTEIFNTRFQELTSEIKISKATIKPLILLHVDDLERSQEYLNRNPRKIWKLFDLYCRNIKSNMPVNTFFADLNIAYILPRKIFRTIKIILKYRN